MSASTLQTLIRAIDLILTRAIGWTVSVAAPVVRRFPRASALLGHTVLFALALLCAFGMYWNFKHFDRWFRPFFLPMVSIVVGIKLIVFWRMPLLLRGWRYFGLRDCREVIVGALIATTAFIVVVFGFEYYAGAESGWLGRQHRDTFLFTYKRDASGALEYKTDDAGQLMTNQLGDPIRQQLHQFPQSVFLLDFGLTIALVCGLHVLARLYREKHRPVADGGVKKCLIVGARDTGEALLRELLRMSEERYHVVGFLDRDSKRIGSRIHNVSVLGVPDDARALAEQKGVGEILVADPKLPHRALRRMVEQCEGAHVRFQIIPAMEEVIAGRVTVSQFREVDIKDLLGRDPVELDEAGLRAFLHGRRILVTGAGGSIGSEICRQVCSYDPALLITLEQAENNLFEIDREIRAAWPDVRTCCQVADICDATRIRQIFAEHRPEVVFHAAAHKHVPMMELNVGEAVKNNILGTKTVADAAKAHGVERFVMISTDKAVNPTSVMGCTKRVAEMYIQQLRQDSGTQFMTVRFGNVLGSSGSVVPIFRKQIADGGPVTVTHPDMTRYFMTIPEATQLVLQAGVMGSDGDIFVLDMGEPVKIVDLAREMIALSGLRPGEDIEIEFTGVRPGEKLFEELSVRGEDMSPTRHEQIYIWRNRCEDWQRVRRDVEAVIDMADSADPNALRTRLGEIVPEYRAAGANADPNEPIGATGTTGTSDDARDPSPADVRPVSTGGSNRS